MDEHSHDRMSIFYCRYFRSRFHSPQIAPPQSSLCTNMFGHVAIGGVDSSLVPIRGNLDPQIAATPGLVHVLEAVRGHGAANNLHTALCHVVSPPNTPPLSDPELDGRPLSNCKPGLACPGCHPSLTWSDCHRDSFRLGRWSHCLPRSAMWRCIYLGFSTGWHPGDSCGLFLLTL